MSRSTPGVRDTPHLFDRVRHAANGNRAMCEAKLFVSGLILSLSLWHNLQKAGV